MGKYLHGYRHTDPHWTSPQKGFFDLGDIAALVDPDLACWEVTRCPEVGWDLQYHFEAGPNDPKWGSILRCYHVDRDRTFALLYDKLKGICRAELGEGSGVH